MRESLHTQVTETTWNVRETDIEKGVEREWNIHQRSISYDYEAPAGEALPSPDYARKQLPSMNTIGIAEVASKQAMLSQNRRALRKE